MKTLLLSKLHVTRHFICEELVVPHFLRMKVGKKTSFALMVMPDIMFPEKITVGENSIIGYNTTLLAHEYLIREYRLGKSSLEMK